MPKTSAVIDVVSSNLEVKIMLEYSTYFGDPDSHAILFDELFWDEIAVTQVNAIAECTTTLANNLKKMSESYQKKRHQILDEIACRDVYS